MTIFYPDISSFQAGISLKGALAVCVKVTESTNYVNSDYAPAKKRAADAGAFFFAYHFLHAGNAAAQAAHCYSVAGKTPLMLDVEKTTGSMPRVSDVTAFIDAYRKLGGVCYLAYLPHWYWGQIGSPSLRPLAKRGVRLVSSEYTGYTDSDARGWLPYGGMTPVIWQYTDKLSFNGRSVDFNAFRGTFKGDQSAGAVAATLVELKSIVSTGKYPADPTDPPKPAGPVRRVADGVESLKDVAERRNTTVGHLIAVSFRYLSAANRLRMAWYLSWPGQKMPMPKGLVYWSSH